MSIAELQGRLSALSLQDQHGNLQAWTDAAAWIEVQAKHLGVDGEARHRLIEGDSDHSDLTTTIGSLWKRVVEHAVATAPPAFYEDGERIKEIPDHIDDPLRQGMLRTAILLTRLVRNAAVDNTKGQKHFFAVVPAAIDTLWMTTSFAVEYDPSVQVFTRTLVQMLANLITDNNTTQTRLWIDHLGLDVGDSQRNGKGRAPSDLLVRLLDSPDAGTQIATQVLLLNLTMESTVRSQDISGSQNGSQVMRRLLRLVEQGLEQDEQEEEEQEAERISSDGDSGYGISLLPDTAAQQRRRQRYENLGVLYAFFTNLFRRGLFDRALTQLEPDDQHGSNIDASIISASQITLLKLLDAHLHHVTPEEGNSELDQSSGPDFDTLSTTFQRLARWANTTMKASLAAGPQAAVDGRLIEVHVALILLLQCLLSCAMATESGTSTSSRRTDCERIVDQIRQDGFVDDLIDVLHTTALFSPPISPFTPTHTTQQSKTAVPAAPQGHVLSSTGRAQTTGNDDLTQRPRLDKLKRDLVGVLGVMSFRRTATDAEAVQRVQDRVREKGGLLDVLNLTQLDERNPYIRERAIFALRNLLRGNQASQDLIAQLKPINPDQQVV